MTKKVPLRKCTGCGEMKQKKEMIRVLLSPDGGIMIDVIGKKNGRGAYICNSMECLQKARKNKGIERSLKVSIPEAVYNDLEKELSDIGE